MDGNDVQLLVGASASPPGIFAPVESGSATRRTVQEILESIKLPMDPAELEAMINEAMMNQAMATEDLNALITALESAEESTPILVSPEPPQNLVSSEPPQNLVKQETAPTSQHKVQATSKVQDMHGAQDDQGVQEVELEVPQVQGQEMVNVPVGLSAEDLAQALRQLDPNLQNGRISLGILLR